MSLLLKTSQMLARHLSSHPSSLTFQDHKILVSPHSTTRISHKVSLRTYGFLQLSSSALNAPINRSLISAANSLSLSQEASRPQLRLKQPQEAKGLRTGFR